MTVEQGEPIRGRWGRTEPVGDGWVYGCAVCRDRPKSLAMCKCLSDGNEYALCFPCLTAMGDLGMIKERIEEHVLETGGSVESRRTITTNKHDLLRCPRDAGVRVAVLLARR